MSYNVFDVLRELDSIVDFARAKLQWDILFFINSRGPSSISEIAEGTNNSKKAVIDAIRKLVEKELIIKVKYDVYDLSEKGKQVLNKLNYFTSHTVSTQKGVDGDNNVLSNNADNPSQNYYLLELIKMSLLNNGTLPIDKVSRELGISKQTVKYYLELFMRKKIFKKVNKKSLLGKSVQTVVLTSEGRKIAYKVPSLIKIRNNLFLRLLLKITFSISYESALMKLMVFFALSSPIIIYYDGDPPVRILGIVWLYMLVFTSLLSIFAYLTMR
ncbi:MarR family transcriptional regulator [Saccharolobus solfataricus]|uniref:MarR family transcriptional regulator n=2 Tax=Saccharolobus solfataricus TaxID=2287 RepID=A0A0E3K9Z9_SACSO|nr:HTH-type transcriptional activator ArnR [Saccharolobus solfataricus]AKA72581.1 MarR family transcriptional regulator [Saccharolobus solfataricus]AKA75280.1 MarR family transcriptional regulator [Saccharolobus solfataricus]AKA77973.1 MarR family transcriptional regulator [Saccharolobus solfataricus]AZF67092.1 MarR family transcriptional regulator [Saccharolobus solfataricus]AZF69712.1 MarR family transcriptional regulator [Saccharolobus solfataricus]